MPVIPLGNKPHVLIQTADADGIILPDVSVSEGEGIVTLNQAGRPIFISIKHAADLVNILQNFVPKHRGGRPKGTQNHAGPTKKKAKAKDG